jgi:hypothetical protein
MARRVTSSAFSRGGLVLFRGPAGDYHGFRDELRPFFHPLSGQFDPLEEHGRSHNLLAPKPLPSNAFLARSRRTAVRRSHEMSHFSRGQQAKTRKRAKPSVERDTSRP